MLTLNIKAVMNAREIYNHNAFLCNHGFSYYTASRLLNNKVKSISHSQLEKLCMLLRCTPNDLYVWNGANSMMNNNNQPLSQLQQIAVKPPTNQIFNNLPLQKVLELRNSIDAVVNNEPSNQNTSV